jgi:hypothetical protein
VSKSDAEKGLFCDAAAGMSERSDQQPGSALPLVLVLESAVLVVAVMLVWCVCVSIVAAIVSPPPALLPPVIHFIESPDRVAVQRQDSGRRAKLHPRYKRL